MIIKQNKLNNVFVSCLTVHDLNETIEILLLFYTHTVIYVGNILVSKHKIPTLCVISVKNQNQVKLIN